MHIERWSLALALAGAFALGTGALACGGADSGADDEDEAVSTEDALTGSVAVGSTLEVISQTALRSYASIYASRLKTLYVGDKLTVLVSSPSNGFYKVKN
jgi:hypothetical protein